MAKKKYEDIRLEPSDNGGAILSYCEMTPNPEGKDYMNYNRSYKKEVYTKAELGKATARMNTLVGLMTEDGGEEEGGEKENVTINIEA